MPSIGTLILADGQDTPANHTFGVVSGQAAGTPATWQDRSAGVYAGFKTIAMSVTRSKSQRSSKVEIRITDPTLAVTAPASGSGIQPNPTVAYATFAKVEIVLPDACSLGNRKDLLAYLRELLAEATVTDAVVNLAPTF